MAAKVTVEEVRKAQRAEGPATVLAIGTATPVNCMYQADYPDYYFRVTKSEHLTDLKEKFKRICAYTYSNTTDERAERPLFQLVSAAQTILPDSEGAIEGHLREVGLTFHLQDRVPRLISAGIEGLLEEAFAPLGISDWNSIFWVAHPGGPAILNMVEARAGLDEARMRATRHILAEYGNMSSACVLFILDEMRKRSLVDGQSTTGEGMDWGVLFGFGPGLTVKTVVLHSVPIAEGQHPAE